MSKHIIHLVAAARPNFMKVAPLYHALSAEDWCRPILIHTGQHYDSAMSQAFLDDLQLPKPDVQLGIGSGTHAQQTGRVMEAYERVCMEQPPDLTVVVGDVNSTIACAIAAKKLLIPVAHLEAGLRSWDRSMPEEINRILTDSISDLLLTPSPDGDENLIREGIAPSYIARVGNIMIDSFERLKPTIEATHTYKRFGLSPKEYAVTTIHRPANVDSPESLERVLEIIMSTSQKMPVVFPVHPRTKNRLIETGLHSSLEKSGSVILTEPMGYCDFMGLVLSARFVLTDSGGIQEETTHIGIPCITLRENTERPVTITQGTNRLATLENAEELVALALSGKWPKGRNPDLWDGNTAKRTVACLKEKLITSEKA